MIPEVKFQPPADWRKFAASRRVQKLYGISPLLAINQFAGREQDWQTPKKRDKPKSRNQLHRSLAIMIEQTNSNLQLLGLKIHISLVQHQGGFGLDIYDCTGDQLCSIIGEEEVSMAELPTLLKNLQEHAGLLIDVQS